MIWTSDDCGNDPEVHTKLIHRNISLSELTSSIETGLFTVPFGRTKTMNTRPSLRLEMRRAVH